MSATGIGGDLRLKTEDSVARMIGMPKAGVEQLKDESKA
jgi:hypothetical protein